MASKRAFVVDVTGREHLEVWRQIPGYGDKYEASNLGRVRSGGSRILKQRLQVDTHYPVVELSDNGRSRETCVHWVVLLAFRGAPPEGHEGCHNNGVGTDNRVENLRWDTRSGNTMDQVAHGTHHHARKTHCPQGHPYDAANTYLHPRGRVCRACKRDGDRKRYRKLTGVG